MTERTGPDANRSRLHADRLAAVRYDLRGPVLRTVRELEAAGEQVLMLNLGNPAQFGLHTPDWLREAAQAGVAGSDAYSDSRGLLHAREAVANRYEAQGLRSATSERVYLGNGVSELILLSVQALANPGDEFLIPSPDYPLWTAAVRLSGATAVHYRCHEREGWLPDPEEVEALVTPRTKALVLINPNNPTGAVYPLALVARFAEIAARYGIVLLADEIYDEITYDTVFSSAAAIADDAPAIVFGGLSKVWRAAGYRGGWMQLSAELARREEVIEGIDLLTNLRLCPNVIAQQAVAAAAPRFGDASALVAADGVLRAQRDTLLAALAPLPDVNCVQPSGALYAFAGIDLSPYDFDDDQDLALTLLKERHVLLSHGSGFNLHDDPHLRFVFLAPQAQLVDAAGRLAEHLSAHRRR